MKNFTKNDEGFVCIHCKKTVQPLGYTSRNHCPVCLYSIHVDILPGDRQNTCKGALKPIGIETKKGEYIIVFECEKCGKVVRNKVAQDDNFEQILKVSSYGKRDKY